MALGRKYAVAVVATLAIALVALVLATRGAPESEDAFGAAEGSGRWVPSRPASESVIWAVGDGADGSIRSRQVVRLMKARRLDRLLYLGDVYESGSATEYREHYKRIWGRLADSTAPVVGNHEASNAEEGYIPYWRRVHGGPVPAHYSFKASGWQLLALNSEIANGPGSSQERWLQRKLAGVPELGNCRIAFWHRPRYSASMHGDSEDMEPIWQLLAGRAKAVLGAHDHGMQRMKPVDGITQFISGAGGNGLYDIDKADPRLAFANDRRYGALRLRLRHEHMNWRFVSTRGQVLDEGALRCRHA